MMKKIEVGMMVKHCVHGIGTIAKIEMHPIYEEEVFQVDYGNDYHEMYTMDYSIVAQTATHNLIDLIQVGDYVDGKVVIEVDIDDNYIINEQRGVYGIGVYSNDIKTVFTKEQYEANCFHVKGREDI